MLAGATQALAHPHVYVTMKSEIVYGADGTVTGVRHAWAFDDMFSTYALQGLESKKKGVYTREELQPLAEVNVTSLKEYDFFTQAQGDGKKVEFAGADGLLARVQGHRSHFAFHLAGENAGESQVGQCRNLRSVLFHRFQFRRQKGSGDARGHAGRSASSM